MNKRYTLLAIVALWCGRGQVLGQQSQTYASMISEQSSREILSILASDDFEGRDTGTRGGLKAAKYIASQFKAYGLTAPNQGKYFQEVPLVVQKTKQVRFDVAERSFALGEDFIPVLSPNVKGLKEAKSSIVFVGYGLSESNYDEYGDMDLAGKVVLFIRNGEPKDTQGNYILSGSDKASSYSSERDLKVTQLHAKNPALLLAYEPRVDLVGENEHFLAQIKSAQMQLKPDEEEANAEEIPRLFLVGSDMVNFILSLAGETLADWERRVSQSKKPQTMSIDAPVKIDYKRQRKTITSPNVLGYLEGSDPKLKEELIVVSAHYDHLGNQGEGEDKIYNGADDDGSGTTALLEMAHAFAQAKAAGHGVKRSLLFLAVTGEEKGLFGSQWYTNHPIFPLQNTVTDLNIDMIGRVDEEHQRTPEYVYVIGSAMLSTELKQVNEAMNEKYVGLTLDYRYDDPEDPNRFYYRSDHYNFAKHNIPIIFYFNGVHEDYHQVSDEVSKINFPMLVKRTRLVFHTAWALANRPNRVKLNSK